MLHSTLCYLENRRGEYLMLHRVKKEQDVNRDKWIGVGGKLLEGESPEECLLREVREETGLTLTRYRFRGVITFLAQGWETEQMYLFTADGWTGELTDACDEGELEWVAKDRLEGLPLWEGDKLFLRLLAQDESVFLMKLEYQGDALVRAVLNGRALTLQNQEVTPLKFKEMPYERPDAQQAKDRISQLTQQLKDAENYIQAKETFLELETLLKHLETMSTLAYTRHSIDTRDEFYDGEVKFFNTVSPELEEYQQQWTLAMLDSPYRPDFTREYGELMFRNAEIRLKAFDPAIIPEMQQEAELEQAYEKLLASAQIPFEGKTYTLSQLTPFKSDPDDARRLAAWKADGQWYKDNQAELDRLYDELVHLRDAMGRKLGYEGYTTLGYYRMGRNCYGKDDVEKFRAAVREYLVPVADRIYRQQAKRLGKEYPMSFADNALEFRSGNPRPQGTPQEILDQGMKFYSELSPETAEFFRTMLDWELLDVLSTEGKAGGGYCTAIPDYKVPFIFANFNGTQGDVEVVTHEAGHAFAAWTNRDRVPMEYTWPSMEACEVHSMSMEFMAWPWAEGFFGGDARKFRYSHLASALTFIPYGTLVDHFQHEVYARPDMSPAERHGVWKSLLSVYMPWVKLDGEIPFYSQGEGWQRQHHIYSSPFYYIDYCLAQTVALQFWALSQKDFRGAWERYMAYTRQGGTRTFTDLLTHAGLDTPFDPACLREVCRAADAWLDGYDLTGIS